MMRRPLALLAFVIVALVAFGTTTHTQRLPTRSDDLARPRKPGELVRVIVQADDSALSTLRARHGNAVRRQLTGAVVLELTKAQFDALTRDGSIENLSGDLPVVADMAVTNSVTGAWSVWQGTSGLLGLGGTPGFTGSEIGVAVLDSGIASHSALGDRVAAHVNFVSTEAGVTGDPFGHGTHIAGIAGGSDSAAVRVTTAYNGGSAPGVRLIDVRVLGRNGSGLTSDVIAGIDWTIANRSKYGIRVINLSLGHSVAEPSATDPLCRAVARAVGAGIVVVASAGNYGRAPDGSPVLGGVTSPGNSPLAITVGAIDTAGTVDRGDDTVAPYSSRGPTRFDFGVKPDVVAPGTRLVSLEAYNSYLSKTYPAWHVAGTSKNAYLRMSGTSMATAVVTGGVALLLDAEPDMDPAQVKIALQMGARFVANGGLIGGGAGSVDFAKSLELAQGGLVPSLLNTITSLLGLSSGATYRDTGTLINRVYDRTGIKLLGLLDLGQLWENADSAEWGVLHLAGLTNVLGGVPANRLVWGEVSGWTSSYYVIWGSSIQSPSGQYVIWGSSEYSDPNYVIWGSSIVSEDGR
jgi:serine protease AprX